MKFFSNHKHAWGPWENITKGEDAGYTQPYGYWQPAGHPPATFTRGRLVIQNRTRKCEGCGKRETGKHEVFYMGANTKSPTQKVVPD
ncbi:MAG: hypothetical protein ABL860_00720 [Candidatus Nitrotoga sp.]